jgi:hypothetical protein
MWENDGVGQRLDNVLGTVSMTSGVLSNLMGGVCLTNAALNHIMMKTTGVNRTASKFAVHPQP